MAAAFPTITLAATEGDALYEQLASSLVEEIRRGRLKPGDRLPGTRTLAQRLGISRTTVLCAYEELIAQGWLVTRAASGTFIAAASAQPRSIAEPSRARTSAPRDPAALCDLPSEDPYARSAYALDLSTGRPDPRLFPVDLLARAYRRALRERGRELLDYGDPRGQLCLRKSFVRLFNATRGLAISPENVLVTRGSQMAIALATQLVTRPGDRIGIERLGYRPVWRAFERAEAEIVPIEVDGSGMRVEDLSSHEPLRAVYVTPHHQYPTMAVMSPARRAELLAWSRRTGAAILEDDYDHEFQYAGRPVLPLMSAPGAENVIYAACLSKVLAPGRRLGCLVASRGVIERAAYIRKSWDRQGDAATEAAVSDLIDSGALERHTRKMRRTYAGRRRALLRALHAHLGGALRVEDSSGGMALWVRIVDGADSAAWREAARTRGVLVGTGRDFDSHGVGSPHLRIGFASHNEQEIEQAIMVLARARRALP